MVEVLQSIAALIVTLSILVTIHEFGHFLVARLCGVKVLRFSVGFGRPLLTFRFAQAQRPSPEDAEIQTRTNEPDAGTEFVVAAIPLGGYVRMLDEREGFVADDEKHLAFNRKTVGQRIAIVSAGPIANFLLAFVAYWFLYTAGVEGIAPILGDIQRDSLAGKAGLREGQEIVAVDGHDTVTWSDVNLRLFDRIGETGEIRLRVKAPSTGYLSESRLTVSDWMTSVDEPNPAGDLGLVLWRPHVPTAIGEVLAGGRAQAAGLRSGDRVTHVDGDPMADWQEWRQRIMASPETTLTVTVERAERSLDLALTPELTARGGETFGYIGAAPVLIETPAHMRREITYPIYSAWIPAASKTWELSAFTLLSIKKMIVGAISPKNLSGPITIAQIANSTAKSGLGSFVRFIALLSISLGVINLLPIPVLDGGHLLYYGIELIARRPVPERVQLWGLQFGMFVIVSIMLLAFYNDLSRL